MFSLVIGSFLRNFDALREYAKTANFQDVENNADGVVYPGICADIPAEIRADVQESLDIAMHRKVDIRYLFMRLSTKGIHAPHGAHTDISMGRFSLMLYVNPPIPNKRCGTALVLHDNGMYKTPDNEADRLVWEADTNNSNKWHHYFFVPLVVNWGFIFDADLMHRAEPVGGYGSTNEDGRLVLTCFFD